jgi:hypothetical protein
MRLTGALLLAVAIFGASIPPRVSWASIRHMEQSVDAKVTNIDKTEPGFLLGPTRGVYLDGYGAVFTAEVDLLPSAAPNPFRPEYSKQDILRLKAKKQMRISLLKQKMRDTIIAASVPLDSVPKEERIALAVTIPYFPWEDGAGLPRQIVMHAPRSLLLKGAKGDTLAVDSGLKVQEF